MTKTRVVITLVVCAAALGIGCGAGTKKVRAAAPGAPKCMTIAACSRDCSAGSAEGCTRLGDKYESGDGVAMDHDKALAGYRKGCDLGDGTGCENAAAAIQEADKAGSQALYRRAAELYQKGCDAGDWEACGDLGAVLESGRGGIPKDEKRAADLYRRACDGGSSLGCFFLGTAFDGGIGVKHSTADAAHAYERACDLGDADGCGIAANYYDDGSLECDVDKARRLRMLGVERYEKQCDAGEDWGCWSAATDLEIGMGIEEDPARATKLLRKGCEQNGRYSCGELGKRLEADEHGDEDTRKEALAMHRKACELGEDDSCLGAWRLLSALGRVDEADGYGKRVVETREKGCARPTGAFWCQHLGEMYEKGTGVMIDANKAVEYKGMAAEKRKARCLEVGGYDCSQAAKAFSEGSGVKADPVVAADLWKRACEAAAYTCTEAGDRFAKGKGVAEDRATAIRMYTRGCDFDVAQSCENLTGFVEDQNRRDELHQKYVNLTVTCDQPEDEGNGDEGDGDNDYDEGDGEPYGD